MKKPDIRYLYDMKNVLYDQKWAKTAPNFELYYMYRGVEEKDGLRYDITTIPARMLGKEFTKTQGHHHKGNYGEVYIVLENQGIYLMQKQKKNIVEDVYVVKAKRGDVVLIPPYYAHITINPANKTLKMANWMARESKSDYQLIEKMGGACYFYTKTGWIKNKKYKKTPKLRFKKPLKSIPNNLDFLRG
ncbi:MAG: glucose-6-phosphate isomerase [Candidatus Nealsonbacteria bacterium]|nr:glucose-6-phosphate isomerase [Candidatus Nealsonbacteria bacterium]